MTRQERRLALVLADRLLAGVGDDDERRDVSGRVVHLKRPLTASEERLLPAEWRALEAIDGAGAAGYLDAIAKVIE